MEGLDSHPIDYFLSLLLRTLSLAVVTTDWAPKSTNTMIQKADFSLTQVMDLGSSGWMVWNLDSSYKVFNIRPGSIISYSMYISLVGSLQPQPHETKDFEEHTPLASHRKQKAWRKHWQSIPDNEGENYATGFALQPHHSTVNPLVWKII